MYQTATFKKLKNVKKDLKQFKTFLLNFERDAQFLTKMEQFAESVEKGITGFKSEAANQFESIQDEIDDLSSDLVSLERKIETWKHQESSPYEFTQNAEDIEVEINKNGAKNTEFEAEITEKILQRRFDERDNVSTELFQKQNALGQDYRNIIDDLQNTKNTILVIDQKIDQNGGLNCGWPSSEHTIFTQIAFKLQNRLDSVPFMDEVSLELPLKSEPAILAHITAFKVFKELDKQKKSLMVEYKALKNRQKDAEATFNSIKLKELESKQSRNKSIGRTQEQR